MNLLLLPSLCLLGAFSHASSHKHPFTGPQATDVHLPDLKQKHRTKSTYPMGYPVLSCPHPHLPPLTPPLPVLILLPLVTEL